jgi:hypothetical protein
MVKDIHVRRETSRLLWGNMGEGAEFSTAIIAGRLSALQSKVSVFQRSNRNLVYSWISL